MTELEQVVLSSAGATAAKTKSLYLAKIREFLAFAGEDDADWTPDTVDAWRDAMVEKDLAPSTINTKLYALKFASERRAKLHRDESLDFARFTDAVREMREKKRQALTPTEVKRLVEALYLGNEPIDIRDRAMIVLMLRTGVRRAGIADLQIEDYKPPEVRFVVKGERIHRVNIDSECQSAVDEWVVYLKRQGIIRGRLFRSITKEGDIHTSLSAGSIHDIVQRRGEQAGIKNLFPHLLRHTCVSMLALAGEPAHRIQTVTGHKSITQLNAYITDLEARSRPVTNSLPPLRPKR